MKEILETKIEDVYAIAALRIRLFHFSCLVFFGGNSLVVDCNEMIWRKKVVKMFQRRKIIYLNHKIKNY